VDETCWRPITRGNNIEACSDAIVYAHSHPLDEQVCRISVGRCRDETMIGPISMSPHATGEAGDTSVHGQRGPFVSGDIQDVLDTRLAVDSFAGHYFQIWQDLDEARTVSVSAEHC
jgi:hypothetical protein